jgi:hypothetical protein
MQCMGIPLNILIDRSETTAISLNLRSSLSLSC